MKPRKPNDYDKKYPLIAEGEYVVVAPYKWTVDDKNNGFLLDEVLLTSGIGIVITKGTVTYMVYMVKSKKMASVSRQRLRVATPIDFLDL